MIARAFFIPLDSIDEISTFTNSFTSPPRTISKTPEYYLDYCGGYESNPRCIRSSGCSHSQYRCLGKGKRSLQPCVRLCPSLFSFTLLPDSGMLPAHTEHSANAFRFSGTRVHEGVSRTASQGGLLHQQQCKNRLQFR